MTNATFKALIDVYGILVQAGWGDEPGEQAAEPATAVQHASSQQDRPIEKESTAGEAARRLTLAWGLIQRSSSRGGDKGPVRMVFREPPAHSDWHQLLFEGWPQEEPPGQWEAYCKDLLEAHVEQTAKELWEDDAFDDRLSFTWSIPKEEVHKIREVSPNPKEFARELLQRRYPPIWTGAPSVMFVSPSDILLLLRSQSEL
jgi:hypothetical protein